jgi:hypothetical protein
MSAKDLEVDCPCCRSRLTIDVRTAQILRWSAAVERDETGQRSEAADEGRWDAALSRVGDREGRGKSRFDEALDRERGRERDLDELFRDAKDRAQGDDGD